MSDTELTAMTEVQRKELKQALGGVESVTSGASPVDASAVVMFTEITTGGTAAQEHVQIGDIPYDEDNGYLGFLFAGFRKVFYLEHLTDPSDTVKIVPSGQQSKFTAHDTAGNELGETNQAVLDYEGASIILVWTGTTWEIDQQDSNNNIELTNTVQYMPAPADQAGIQFLGTYSHDTEGLFKTPVFGAMNSGTQVGGGVSILTPDASDYTSNFTTNGSGGVTHLYLLDLSGTGSEGLRCLMRLSALADPGDTLVLDVASLYTAAVIKNLDGTTPTSVVFDTAGQWLLVEVWSGSEWRIVRGTATVT